MSFNDDGEALDLGQEIRQSLIGLDPNARYAIRVRSVDGLGNKSEWSEAMEFETAPGTSGRPSRPFGVTKDWTQSDLTVTWNPVFTREDGGVADVSHYEFVVITSYNEETGFVTTKRYPVYDTTFTYTRAKQLAEVPFDSSIPFWITAVSRTGERSAEPSAADPFGFGVQVAEHEAHDPTKAPRAQDIGNRILVTMYPEHDCIEEFGVLTSTDGDSWEYLTDTASETYVYTPPGDGTYYFKYRTLDSITETYGAYSPVSYVDYTADGTGVDDHGSLTGLEDDDHPHYLTEGRGDARYLTEATADTLYLTEATADTLYLTETTADGLYHFKIDPLDLAEVLDDLDVATTVEEVRVATMALITLMMVP